MGLVCGTSTRSMPAADTAAAWTAQATTLTPALGAGVKNGLGERITKINNSNQDNFHIEQSEPIINNHNYKLGKKSIAKL